MKMLLTSASCEFGMQRMCSIGFAVVAPKLKCTVFAALG